MDIVMMDVDGVLVSGRPQDGAHLFTDIERDLGMSLETLQQHFFQPRWPSIVTGKKDLMPELAEILAQIAPHVSAEALAEYWFRNDSRIDQSVLAAIDAHRATGRQVFLATNQEHRRAHYLMVDMDIAAHVDGIFYSAAIGHRKPDPAFYAHITQALDAQPDRILLVDDTEANILAARAFGWHGVHWGAGMSMDEVLLHGK